jgi:opacity protein-like surface antigen
MDCKWLASVAVAAMLVPACALADDVQIQQVQTTADPAAASDPSSSSAHAGWEWPHPPGGWLHPYIALDLGYHQPLAIDATSFDPAPDGQPYRWQYRLNGDWDAFLRVGYQVTPHLRVEFDGGLRESNIHSIHSTTPSDAAGLTQGRPGQPWGLCAKTNVPPPCAAVFGDPHLNWAYADNGMVNAVYDFLPQQRLTPFVGVGVGIYHLQFDAHYFFSGVPGPITPQNPSTQTLQLGGSILRPTQFAFQAVGGFSYKLKRKLNLDFTYRYIDAPFLRWNTVNDTPGVARPIGLHPGDFRGASQDVSFDLGLRYQL